jgi:hypothetical protein
MMMNLMNFVFRELCRYYVVDPNIASQCSAKQRRVYIRMGLLMSFFFLCILISSFYATYLIFDQWFFAVIFALFWALSTINIYQFTLINIGGSLFKKSKQQKTLFGWSKVLRFVYMTLIVLTVSKPIELYVFENSIDKFVLEFKTQKQLLYENDIKDYVTKGWITETERPKYINEFNALNNRSNYFVQRLIILNEHFIFTWLITALLLLLFLYPSYRKLKYIESDEYEKINFEREEYLVMDQYKDFKTQYHAVFQHFNKNEHFYEWAFDPPFNTMRIVDSRNHLSHQSFIDSISDTEN